MRRTVGSLGVKLICSAAITLLLCLLIFFATSRSLLTYLAEHEAKSVAMTHLTLIKQAYLSQSDLLLEKVTEAARDNNLVARVSQHSTPTTTNHLGSILGPLLVRYRLSELAIISTGRHLLFHIGNEKDIGHTGDSIASGRFLVVDKGLQGWVASALYRAQTF